MDAGPGDLAAAALVPAYAALLVLGPGVEQHLPAAAHHAQGLADEAPPARERGDVVQHRDAEPGVEDAAECTRGA